MKAAIRVLALSLSLTAFGSVAFAEIPILPNNLTCLDTNHDAMPYQNTEVLQWKRSTPDQTLKRALINGVVTGMYPSKTGHTHFSISIDGDRIGDIEVIYNDEFGSLPAIQVGHTVVACGDYITVGPRARLPSPMGAIIHWLHHNPGDRDGGRHKHGFLIINGRPYGIPTSRLN
jgi:hypothetical protein